MAALRRKHFMLRHIGLAGKIVIIDECHAYDAYMNEYLDRAISWMGAYGVPVILMSATLHCKRREQMISAYMQGLSKRKREKQRGNREKLQEQFGYPLLTWTVGTQIFQKVVVQNVIEKRIHISWISCTNELTDLLSEKLRDGGCAVIILNTVSAAQHVYKALKNSLTDIKLQLYHAQFTAPDRINKEIELLKHMGKASEKKERDRYILIGTQVLEQSLDYDADIMVTQLCPIDLLLQRMGRLHRHTQTTHNNVRQRPERLKQPACYILKDGYEPYDSAKSKIYHEYILSKTIQELPEIITLPTDIQRLVEKVYEEDEINIDDIRKDQYERMIKSKKEKGKGYLLRTPLGDRDTLINMLREGEDISETAAEASVRDGNDTIEVLALKRRGGYVSFLGDQEHGIYFSSKQCPEEKMAKAIALQRLRLPYKLCIAGGMDTIKELEEQNKNWLPTWQESPWLKGKLVLLFDETEQAVLNGYRLQYNTEFGLQCMKEGE